MKFCFHKSKKSPPLAPAPPGCSHNIPSRRERSDRLPVFAWVFFGLALLSLILYAVMVQSVTFSDWFNGTVSAALRAFLAALTSWIPFSLGELILLSLPLILFLVIRHAIKYRCGSWKSTFSYVGTVLSVVSLLISIFILNFAAGYRGTTLDQKLGLERRKVSAQELYDTAEWLAQEINRETDKINYIPNDFSVMPYPLADMNEKLNDAYASFASDHDFIHHTNTRVKPVLISEVMSYMHLTGVYAYFTGEANINIRFPDYTIPYTAAHEMAHQRGIAREDEANFMAFLICLESDDPYIRYSGYLNVYEYVSSALYRADRQLYMKVNAHLNPEVRGEMAAYSRFFEKYKNSTASKVSSSVNNSFLQSQGTVGIQSYGMVVDLAVAYYENQIKETP